jgi:hypothetical protein
MEKLKKDLEDKYKKMFPDDAREFLIEDEPITTPTPSNINLGQGLSGMNLGVNGSR